MNENKYEQAQVVTRSSRKPYVIAAIIFLLVVIAAAYLVVYRNGSSDELTTGSGDSNGFIKYENKKLSLEYPNSLIMNEREGSFSICFEDSGDSGIVL